MRHLANKLELNLRYLTSKMEEQTQVQVTSERKKDPVRVAAGKRLAAISKIAKERKKKINETKEIYGTSVITYVGLVVALVSLVLAFRAHQRETKEPEPRYTPKTVEVVRTKLDSLE